MKKILLIAIVWVLSIVLTGMIVLRADLGSWQTLKKKAKPYHRDLLALVGYDFWNIRQTREGSMMSVTSPFLKVDSIYKSMMGPATGYKFTFIDDAEPELMWITGYSVSLNDDNGDEVTAEYLCHNNLDYYPSEHFERFNIHDRTRYYKRRLVTLAPGQTKWKLPDGFGLPMMSNENVFVSAQVLNLNDPTAQLSIRHHSQMEYVLNTETNQPIKPLFARTVYVRRLLEGYEQPPMASDGISDCRPVQTATDAHNEYDENHRLVTGHWMMAPGRDTIRYRITALLGLPFSTTVHSIAVHMHPFAESLSLRDATADSTLFISTTQNRDGSIGITHLGEYSDIEGMPLFRDHDYELVCITNNTSGVDQDMMAVMYMYLYDKEVHDLLENGIYPS